MCRPLRLLALAALGPAMAACRRDSTSPVELAQFASVSPAGGSVGVDPTAGIRFEFTHGMAQAMGQDAALHEGDVTGAVVAGTWSWSADRKQLVFKPAAPLKSGTRYAIHLGSGMKDVQGHVVGLGEHGSHMGGQWATGAMMSGGMMRGSSCTPNNCGMMGAGWQHANGSYGMVFPFTTA